MSDMTPEWLDELERLETAYRESWDAVRKDRHRLRDDLSCELRTHARDLIEAARDRDRLEQLLKTEIEDNCEYDTEIRAMCGHVDDQYREPLPDVVQKVVDERDRLREVLSFYADRSNWTTPDQVNLDELFNTAMSADSHGERARQALERKDGDQCSTQQS